MRIAIPGHNTVEEFPDDATPEQIQATLAEKYPPTSEQIAAKLKDPSTPWEDISFEEFQAYRKHSSDITLEEGAGLLFDGLTQVAGEIAKGIPAAGKALVKGELPKVAASTAEGAARGTVELGSMAAKIANNVGEFLVPGDDEAAAFSRFIGIKKLDNAVTAARSGEGNLLESMFLEEDIDQDLANALSNVLDPSMAVGGGALGRAATRAAGAPVAAVGKGLERAGVAAGRAVEAVGDKVASVKSAVASKLPEQAVGPAMAVGAAAGAGLVGGLPTAGAALGGLAAPTAAQLAGGAIRGFGESMQSTPTRIGAFQRTAATRPGTLAGQAAGRLTWLDGPLDAAGRVAGGATAGGVTGAVLGGLAEGQEGFYSGIGAGAGLGAAGAGATRLAGQLSGSNLRQAINADWSRWVSTQADDVRAWAQSKGRTDQAKATIMDLSGLLKGVTGEDVRIEVPKDYEAKYGKTAGVFEVVGDKPTIRLHPRKSDADTLAHEAIHAMAKLDGFDHYVTDIKTAFGGKQTPDGQQSVPGVYKESQLNAIFDRYRQRLPRAQRQTWDRQPRDVQLEELAADYFSAYVRGQHPNWLLKGSRTNIPGGTAVLNAVDWLTHRGAAEKLERITGALETQSLGQLKQSKAIDKIVNRMVAARRKAYRSTETISDRDFASYTVSDLRDDATFQQLKDIGAAKGDSNGRRTLTSNYQANKASKEVAADMAARLNGVEGNGGLVQTESGYAGKWFSPEQFSAILDSAFISNKVKEALQSLNTIINEGIIANITYGAATKRNKQGQATYSSRIPVSNRDMIPYKVELSEVGNAVVRALDWSKLRTKAERYFTRSQPFADTWQTYDSLKSDLLGYVNALAAGDRPTAELFGVQKRNLMNKLLGARNTKGNPELPAELKFNEKDNIWKSFRLDRIIDASPTNTKANFDEAAYQRGQQNFSPEKPNVLKPAKKLNKRGGMLYKSASGHRAIQRSKGSKIKLYGPDGKRVGGYFDSIEDVEKVIAG